MLSLATMTVPGKTVLVAPLNWGLGHTSRCIPIISTLLDQGFQVYMASDGDALELLKIEFPTLPAFELTPLHIHYGRYFFWSIFLQSGKFYNSIKQDHQIVNNLYKQVPFNYIISDNRYGVHHPSAHNILLTHQLQLTKPGILKKISRIMFRRIVARFQECWIPDFQGQHNLTGDLSSPDLSIAKKFIGVLSRLEVNSAASSEYELLILLSGPEPSRTQFEKVILDQISQCKLLPKTLLVRGLPLEKKPLLSNHSLLTIQNYADSNRLNEFVNGATFLICRAGYSSIMDLVKLGKKAILVPTPGQSEQEYLSKRLKDHPAFLCVKQADFNLSKHLIQLKSRPPLNHPAYDSLAQPTPLELLPGT